MTDQKIEIECITNGFEEAQEKVEALVDAYDGFPPQVQIKHCRNCTINIYPTQNRFVAEEKNEDEGF